tara:strand:+ start:68 stop:535 length:468 start_codon:yes stop_codon:yes gene_type:complete
MTYSVFIPKVFKNITVERISSIFESKKIGSVHYIDIVHKKNEKNNCYYSAFIHFKTLYDSHESKKFVSDLENNLKTTLLYDDPWYWIILPNNGKKRITKKNQSDLVRLLNKEIHLLQRKINNYEENEIQNISLCVYESDNWTHIDYQNDEQLIKV